MKKTTIIVNELCVNVAGIEDVSELGFLIYDKEVNVSSKQKRTIVKMVNKMLPNGGEVVLEGKDMMDFIKIPEEIDDIKNVRYKIHKITTARPLVIGNKRLLTKIKKLLPDNTNMVNNDETYVLSKTLVPFKTWSEGSQVADIFDGIYNNFKNDKLLLKQNMFEL